MNDINPIIRNLRQYCEKEDFMGWDAYDALNSPLIRLITFKNKYLQAGFTQFFRRSNINFRPLVGIKKGHNPKGIGLFLEAYSKMYAINPDKDTLLKIEYLLDILKETISKNYSGNSWGYNFPWQSRVVYKPRWTPTIVNTAFIGHALLTCHEITGLDKALEMAVSIPEFMTKDLNRLEFKDAVCLSYSPIDHEFVHNANMLGASFLVRIGKKLNRQDLIDFSHKCLKYSLYHQNEDGSWFFADRKTHQWIDSFHTGFKLESIRWFIELGEGNDYLKNYEKGVTFYKDNFFLENGLPKYYHNNVYPIDIHCPSEAIYFFSKFNTSELNTLTEKVTDWTVDNMYNDAKGYFYFRRGKKSVNKIPYMRWGQAWMLRGLVESEYNNKLKNG